MRRALERLRSSVDALVVLAILGLGAGELLFGGPGSSFRGPVFVNVIFLVLTTASLLWRRRRALEVLAVVLLGVSIWVATLYQGFQPPIEPFFAMLVAIYSAAAYEHGRRMRLAAAVVICASLAQLVQLVTDATALGDELPVLVYFGIAWGIGRISHHRIAQAAALRDLASQLEREREEKARVEVAYERARIARELHDVVAHSLSVIVVQAAAERRVLGEGSGVTGEVLTSIEQVGREALAELRRLLGVIRKADEELPLSPQPGLRHLETLIEQVRVAGLPVDLNVEGENVPLAAGPDLCAYRVVQEGLTNALKHAGPARAEVVVRYTPHELELEISDDGRGPTDGSGGGHGLVGMRERIALYGGSLEAGQRNGGGYRVRASIPIERISQ